jgi:hypothetical protein
MSNTLKKEQRSVQDFSEEYEFKVRRKRERITPRVA